MAASSTVLRLRGAPLRGLTIAELAEDAEDEENRDTGGESWCSFDVVVVVGGGKQPG